MKITIPKNHHILKKATLNLVGRFSHISTFAQNLIDQPEVPLKTDNWPTLDCTSSLCTQLHIKFVPANSSPLNIHTAGSCISDLPWKHLVSSMSVVVTG
jgi:hypothetical protein